MMMPRNSEYHVDDLHLTKPVLSFTRSSPAPRSVFEIIQSSPKEIPFERECRDALEARAVYLRR